MKKIIKILLLLLSLFVKTTITSAYFTADDIITTSLKAKDYKIILNASGGTYNTDTIIIQNGKTNLPIPVKNGYTFLGYINNITGINYAPDKVNIDEINNKELYAKWQIINYTISYDLNGGTLVSAIENYNIESETFTLPIPTKQGYTFIGWTSNDILIPTKNITMSKGSYGDKKFIANWKATTYNISYNYNGGFLLQGKTNPTTYNIESSFSLNNPIRTGYTFLGYSGTGLSKNEKNVNVAKGNYGDRNYTANWQINSYKANYYVNGNLYSSNKVNYNSTVPNLSYPVQAWEVWDGWQNIHSKMPANDITINGFYHEANCYVWAGHLKSQNGYAIITQVVAAVKNEFTGVTNPYEMTSINGDHLWAMHTDSSLKYSQVIEKLPISMNRYIWWNYAEIHCDNGYATAFYK